MCPATCGRRRNPAVAERPAFQEKQYRFAAHIRDPGHCSAPEGIEDRRLAIYRELFFNNLQTLLSSSFPVLKKVHEPEKWRSLVREFMVRHRAHTPYFLEIPREFLEFVEHGHEPAADDFPFLLELAHYEWAEVALSVAPLADDLSRVDPGGDMLDGVPAKSALAWLFRYRFPVHRISPAFLPREPGEQPTWLVVHRKPDLAMGFMELNGVTARLLECIDDNQADRTGREILARLAEETQFDAAALLQHGLQALLELRDAHILLGTRTGTRRAAP
jgi:hypothetical protein